MSHRSPPLPGHLAPIIRPAVPRFSFSAIKIGLPPAIRNVAYRPLILLCVAVCVAMVSSRVWPAIRRPPRSWFRIWFESSFHESLLYGSADLDSPSPNRSLGSPTRLVEQTVYRRLGNNFPPGNWKIPIGARDGGSVKPGLFSMAEPSWNVLESVPVLNRRLLFLSDPPPISPPRTRFHSGESPCRRRSETDGEDDLF